MSCTTLAITRTTERPRQLPGVAQGDYVLAGLSAARETYPWTIATTAAATVANPTMNAPIFRQRPQPPDSG